MGLQDESSLRKGSELAAYELPSILEESEWGVLASRDGEEEGRQRGKNRPWSPFTVPLLVPRWISDLNSSTSLRYQGSFFLETSGLKVDKAFIWALWRSLFLSNLIQNAVSGEKKTSTAPVIKGLTIVWIVRPLGNSFTFMKEPTPKSKETGEIFYYMGPLEMNGHCRKQTEITPLPWFNFFRCVNHHLILNI